MDLDHFTKLCIQIIDHLTYLALSILGLYFIVEGNVIQNFNLGRTNYAQYSEPITELPTILTIIDHVNRSQYKYGIDFNISVGEWMWSHNQGVSTNLTFGVNVIAGGLLKVEFEAILEHFFKITPINFSHGMPLSYFMKYKFKKEDDTALSGLSKVSAILSAENNSVTVPFDWKHFDGNIHLMRLGLGEQGFVTILPRKKKYRSGKGCRNEPHNEIMVRKILKQLSESCSKPCHYSWKWGKRLDKMYEHLPICQSTEERKCAEKAIMRAIQIGEEDIKKPCQTLEYKTDISKNSMLPRNQIQYLL